MACSYIEPVLFLYILTLYLNIPMEKQMIYRKVCLSHYNQTFCDSINAAVATNISDEENVIQAESAQWDMYCNIARLLPTIVSTIHLGAWSDGVGRKKIIMFAVFGETLNAIGSFLNAWYFSAPLPFMFIGSILTGFCGNFAAILMGVLSYIGDVTTPDTRTIRIVILDALVFLSSLIALISGGIILQKLGFLYVYAIDVGLYMIIIIYMLFVKESYVPTEEIKLKDVFCGNKFKKYADLFKQEDNRRTKFSAFIACFCALFFVTTGIDNVLILYLLHTPLTFTSTSIGYVLASESSVKFVGAILVTVILVKTFKWRDSSLILLCSIAVAGYALSLAFSRINWEIYVATIWGLGVCSGVAACRSGLSKMVPLEELGKLNSVVCILQNICLLISGIVYNNIYHYTVHISPSFTLYIISGFCLVPVVLSFTLKVYERRIGQYELITSC